MNWKIALALSAVTTLAGNLALSGCGGDDCTRATDHKVECMPDTSTSTSTGGMMMEACGGAVLCQSQCINAFTCTQIQGNAPDYVKCLTACQGK